MLHVPILSDSLFYNRIFIVRASCYVCRIMMMSQQLHSTKRLQRHQAGAAAVKVTTQRLADRLSWLLLLQPERVRQRGRVKQGYARATGGGGARAVEGEHEGTATPYDDCSSVGCTVLQPPLTV